VRVIPPADSYICFNLEAILDASSRDPMRSGVDIAKRDFDRAANGPTPAAKRPAIMRETVPRFAADPDMPRARTHYTKNVQREKLTLSSPTSGAYVMASAFHLEITLWRCARDFFNPSPRDGTARFPRASETSPRLTSWTFLCQRSTSLTRLFDISQARRRLLRSTRKGRSARRLISPISRAGGKSGQHR